MVNIWVNSQTGYERAINGSHGPYIAMMADEYEPEAVCWLRQWFVYPDKQLLTARTAASMPAYSILMEMRDGRILFLTLSQRNIPTQVDLEKMAEALCRSEVDLSSKSAVESWLCDDAQVVAQILGDDIESPSSWDGPLKAVFLDAVICAVPADGLDGQEIRRRIERNWSEGIARFVSALDTRAVAMARSAGGLLPAYYNYFVVEDAIVRRNRLQATECFPLLLPDLATNKSYAGICRVIDRGEPLVEKLVGFYGVTKSAVKFLAGLPISLVDPRWQSRVGTLFRLIDGITPEFRPGNPDEWKRFFRTEEFIAGISRMPVSTTQNRLWLGACSRTKFRLPEGGIPDTAAVARIIDDLFVGLREAMRWEIENTLDEPVSELVLLKLTNHASMATGGLDKMHRLARKYSEVFCREQQSFLQHERELILGIRWHSPLPEGAACYQRDIVPLCTPEELILEGQNMKNCVGGYSGRCLRGESQIWSLRQLDGKPVSTLETTIDRKSGRLVPKVVQLRAVSNSTPGQECDMAAYHLIKLLSQKPEVLEDYWKWKVAVGNLSRSKRELLVLTKPIIAALKAVLPGKISFESLVEMGISLARKREAEECR